MTGDYKYDIQVRAEELAESRYQTDFYALPDEKQTEVYKEASANYWDALADHADNLRKAKRGG